MSDSFVRLSFTPTSTLPHSRVQEWVSPLDLPPDLILRVVSFGVYNTESVVSFNERRPESLLDLRITGGRRNLLLPPSGERDSYYAVDLPGLTKLAWAEWSRCPQLRDYPILRHPCHAVLLRRPILGEATDRVQVELLCERLTYPGVNAAEPADEGS